MRFPDRSTKIGQVINAYLSGGETLDDHVVHLLFSSNRWEKVKELRDTLDAGTHVIVDR
jgi:dTMP kinase